MKRALLYTAISLLAAFGASAQPWMPANINGPVKLQDVITYYQAHPMPTGADDDDKDRKEGHIKEDKDYHFDRWKWYWQDHLDSNGYMVSPVKTWEEWTAYLQKENDMKKLARTTGTQSQWSFQGPAASVGGEHGVGRINVAAFHPTDSNTIWIGAAGGGVWKTNDDGNTWTSVSNNLPVLGVSDIVFNPLNPQTVYLCTGDRDNSDTYSMGVFKTIDGGNTWDSTGLYFNINTLALTNSILINPLDTSTLIAATSEGMYRTLNSGVSWTKVFNGNFKQVVYDPADTNVMYATGITSVYAQIFRSADGGATWAAVTSFSNTGRVTLATTPSYPNIVRAISSDDVNYGVAGIYSSSDTGKTFTITLDDAACDNNLIGYDFTLPSTSCSGNGWYSLSIAIDPRDTNAMYVGGVNTWGSSDAGKTWQMVNQWYSYLPSIPTVHADKHFLGFNPIAPDRLYECNDGGIHETTNPYALWIDKTNGLGITEFYRNAVSNIAPFALGGAQDNGCKSVTNSQTTAVDVLGGDGMQVQMDYTNPQIFYAESQYGDINKTTNGGATMNDIAANISSPAPTGSWVTPYIISPQSPGTIFAGFDRVYASTDYGNSWTAVSPVFWTGKTIDRVVEAVTNSNYIYVLVNNGIRYTTDFGNTWQVLALPATGTISDIVVDPKDENTLWITYSGYSSTKVARHTVVNAVATWKIFNGQLPNIPVNCLAIDSANGTIYIGTDVSVFYYDTTAAKWNLYNTGLPVVRVNDLNINYTTGELWAATYGRGMWKSPRYDTVISNGISVIPYAADVLTVAPDPNYGHFTISTGNKSFIDKKTALRLINAAGQSAWSTDVMFSSGKLNIDVTGLKPGVYILEAIAENAIARTRVVIY